MENTNNMFGFVRNLEEGETTPSTEKRELTTFEKAVCIGGGVLILSTAAYMALSATEKAVEDGKAIAASASNWKETHEVKKLQKKEAKVEKYIETLKRRGFTDEQIAMAVAKYFA